MLPVATVRLVRRTRERTHSADTQRSRGRKGIPYRLVSPVTRNLLAFVVAAILEIAGCFAFWAWLRQGRSVWVALLGVVSLIGFAAVLTRVDSVFAGRAYAAYGGIYIAASLGWLWVVEHQRPTLPDLLGAAVAIIGALIVIGFGART